MCYLEWTGDKVTSRGVRAMKRRLRGFDAGKLRNARLAVGLSGGEVARRSKVGASTYSQWELGRADPGIAALARCVAVLGIKISDVVVVDEADEHLGDLRVARGLTQGDLAALVSVSPQHVGALERGHVSLSTDLAEKLAAVLDYDAQRVRAAFERVRNRPPDVLP